MALGTHLVASFGAYLDACFNATLSVKLLDSRLLSIACAASHCVSFVVEDAFSKQAMTGFLLNTVSTLLGAAFIAS
jgi:hypothetical protein